MSILEALTDQYLLKANQVQFWTPYFINLRELSPDPEHFHVGPFRGKGTPGQIQSWVIRYSLYHPVKRSPEEWRQVLIDNGVGVDCSGFVFHVLDGYLRRTVRKSVAGCLYVPKSDVVTAFDNGWRPPNLTSELIRRYPIDIPMRQFCNDLHRDPRRNTNVKRLASEHATIAVANAALARLGDILALSGPDGDHIGIVVGVEGKEIIYADSVGKDLRGVSKYHISITNPSKGLEEQDWGPNGWYVQRYTFEGLRRLKVLADAR